MKIIHRSILLVLSLTVLHGQPTVVTVSSANANGTYSKGDGPIDIINLSRSHNNANILSFGARFISTEKVAEAVKLWLNEPFAGGRHQARIDKLDK